MQQMETSVSGIYAIGDVTGKAMLAHVASAQGKVAVENIMGHQTADAATTWFLRGFLRCLKSVGLDVTEAASAGTNGDEGRHAERRPQDRPFSIRGVGEGPGGRGHDGLL